MSTRTSLDFKQLFESAPGLFLVLEPADPYRILGATDAYLRATHTERDAIVGRALFDAFPDNPEDPEATGTGNLRASLERACGSRAPDTMAVQKYDVRRPASQGGGFERRFWSPVNTPVIGADGQITCLIHRVEDVTAFVEAGDQHQREILQRTAELDRVNRELRAALADGERREQALDQFFQLSEDLLCVSGADGYFKRLNPAWERVLGYSIPELLAVPWEEFVHLDDRRTSTSAADALGRETPIRALENRYRRRDGTYRWLSWSAAASDEGDLRYCVARDVTESKEAAAALREAHAALEHRFEVAVLASAQMLFEQDLDRGTATYANEAGLGFAAADLVGGVDRWIDLIHPDDRDGYRNGLESARRAQATYRLEYRLRRADGRYFSVESRGRFATRPDGDGLINLGFVSDISERRALEEQFRQAQKMEAVGTLAGGIAHDFNNLIGVIVGYCDLLTDRCAADKRVVQQLDEIRKAGNSAAELTRQLLTFGRKRVAEPKVINLGAIVSDLSNMLGRVVGEHIKLDVSIDPESGQVMADRGQLEQVVVNLAVNARDAMPQGGLLAIRVDNAVLDDGYVRLHPETTPGRYLKITVGDTGIGMDEGTRQRMFEPFFTTKRTGTGLGLATVYGIIKQFGGSINVYSEPGRGTIFRIYLPRIDASVPELSEAGSTRAAGGSETILLAEDSTPLRTLAREFLQQAGYSVLEAGNGAEAVQVAGEALITIDLLLTDVVMPEMTGIMVAERVKHHHPSVRTLYMSGYADNQIVHGGVLDPGVTLLQKPFTKDGLLSAVRRVLDSAPAGG